MARALARKVYSIAVTLELQALDSATLVRHLPHEAAGGVDCLQGLEEFSLRSARGLFFILWVFTEVNCLWEGDYGGSGAGRCCCRGLLL